MADFYERTGKMALGSRLRRLSEQITVQAAAIYEMYEVDLQPKWFPVLYSLSGGEERSIMDIAREIGHTHPSVSQIVREMTAKGYIAGAKGADGRKSKAASLPDATAGRRDAADRTRNSVSHKDAADHKKNPAAADGRKNFVVLSAAGRALLDKMQPQLTDVQAAIERTMKETDHDLWRAIAEWEFLLDRKSLLRRVQEEKKLRESGQVQIVDYTAAHRVAFKRLNEEWITKYFRMEKSDHKALDHPQEYILEKGGHIFMAMLDGQAVGACALIRMDRTAQPGAETITGNDLAAPTDTGATSRAALRNTGAKRRGRSAQPTLVFELAKMAVSPLAQGKGIGLLLGQACIEKARALGAEKIYLESNTRLKPAISLYHKLGFRKITGRPSPYERSDIQMELRLD